MNIVRTSFVALIALTFSGCGGPGYAVGIAGTGIDPIKPGESTYFEVEVMFEKNWANKNVEMVVDYPSELTVETAKSSIVLDTKGHGKIRYKVTANENAKAGVKKFKVSASAAKNVGTSFEFSAEVK